MVSSRKRPHPRLLVAVAVAFACAAAGGCSSSSLSADGGGDASPTSACTIDALYTYGSVGGFVLLQEETTLTPPGSYRRTRMFSSGFPDPPSDVSCAPALPACDGPSIDVADIMGDLASADVRAALGKASPPIYGEEIPDVGVFQLLRADGRGFVVARDCQTGPSCHGPTPPGIARLVSDLQALDQQQLADPTCGPLAPTH